MGRYDRNTPSAQPKTHTSSSRYLLRSMYNNGSVQALYHGVGLCLIGTDHRNETILLTFLRPGDPI